jgi:hypothetical protein
MTRSLTVLVTTADSSGAVEQVRTINYLLPGARRWLGAHCSWALNHGRTVTTSPVDTVNAEAAE